MSESRSAASNIDSTSTPSIHDRTPIIQQENSPGIKGNKPQAGPKTDHSTYSSSQHDRYTKREISNKEDDEFLFPGETDDFERNLLNIRPVNPLDAVVSENDNYVGLFLCQADLDKLRQIFPSWTDHCFDLDEIPRLGALRSSHGKNSQKVDTPRDSNNGLGKSNFLGEESWVSNKTRNLWEVDPNRWPAPVQSINAKIHWSSITVSTLGDYPGLEFLTFSSEGYMNDMRLKWSEQIKTWKLELSKIRSIPFFVWAMNFEKKLIAANLNFFLTHNFLKMGSSRITPLHVAENDFVNHGLIGQLFPNAKLSLSAYDTWREIKSSHLKGHPEKLIQVILNNFLMNRFTREFHINNCITKINSIRYCMHAPPYPETEIKRELLKKFAAVYGRTTEISQRAKLSPSTPLKDIITTIDLISIYNSTNKTVTLPSGELLIGTAGDLSPNDGHHPPNSGGGGTGISNRDDHIPQHRGGPATLPSTTSVPATHSHNKVTKPGRSRNDPTRLDERQQSYLRDEVSKAVALEGRSYSGPHSGNSRYDSGTYSPAYFI